MRLKNPDPEVKKIKEGRPNSSPISIIGPQKKSRTIPATGTESELDRDNIISVTTLFTWGL